MSVLFGHPGGNPNSHHAALAHFEAGRLEAFCVPWMPSRRTIASFEFIPLLRNMSRRFSRRAFAPLETAPKIQGRVGELQRLITRGLGFGDEGLSYEANDWLMKTMLRACRRPAVTAVHSYEDCSLWQFEEAKRLGKACIYDMPIGYYPAWERTQAELIKKYAAWLPEGGLPSGRWVRPEQKKKEMELADIVLAPGGFVESTIKEFHPYKQVARAPYGVDLEFWRPSGEKRDRRKLRFIYAGQLSLRKGIPLLLEAWECANLRDAELVMVGSWQLSERKGAVLPAGVRHLPACSSSELRTQFQDADIFVFPSYFEGFGLVLTEALACGLPAIASMATAGPDVLTAECGKLIPTGNIEALVDALRWFHEYRDALPGMRLAARRAAEACTWENYRRRVTEAVTPFV